MGRTVVVSSMPRFRTFPELTTACLEPVVHEIDTGRIWLVLDLWYTVAVRLTRLLNRPRSAPTSSAGVCSGFRAGLGNRRGAVRLGWPAPAGEAVQHDEGGWGAASFPVR